MDSSGSPSSQAPRRTGPYALPFAWCSPSQPEGGWRGSTNTSTSPLSLRCAPMTPTLTPATSRKPRSMENDFTTIPPTTDDYRKAQEALIDLTSPPESYRVMRDRCPVQVAGGIAYIALDEDVEAGLRD